jgi:hypothetical protein
MGGMNYWDGMDELFQLFLAGFPVRSEEMYQRLANFSTSTQLEGEFLGGASARQ